MARSALGRVAITVVAASFALAGCGDDDGGDEGGSQKATAPPKAIVAQIPGRPVFSKPQAPGTYVGAAGETLNPAVAFVFQKDQVVVYVCDGRRSSDWFAGPVEDGRFDLTSERGTRVAGTIKPTGVDGTLSQEDGTELAFVALPAEAKRPRTGLFVFDDPSKKGYKARWIVTREFVRGVSANATGSGTNGLTITRRSESGGRSETDTRFAGVDSEINALLNEVKGLAAELSAARSENVSLRDQLESKQAQLRGLQKKKK